VTQPQDGPGAARSLVDFGDDEPLRTPLPLRHGGPRRRTQWSSRGPNADQMRTRRHRADRL